jgi:hypothetical protein
MDSPHGTMPPIAEATGQVDWRNAQWSTIVHKFITIVLAIYSGTHWILQRE